MFASLNTMRFRVIDRLGLKTFELSQAFPLFYDKVEKSNWFLENVLDTLDEPLDGRLMAHLLADPVGDGGQWDMFRSLVKKYGVCPKEAMPETACSRNTREMDDYVSVISANTADKPFGHTYTVSRLGNVVENGGVRYLNLPVERLKQLAVAQLEAGLPVWFGCDVCQSYLSKEGVMDTASIDVDSLFGFPVEGALTRSERLDYGESVMTHAMVLEGVNLDEAGHPTLWKVENSWGDERGKDGFGSITDAWFDEYVYQVVVDKRFLSDEERHTYETEKPRVLAPWDPMGTLALTR